MKKFSLSKITGSKNPFQKFYRERKGVAALEFAIIAPILILLFIGTLEISLAVSVDRKVSRISSSVADLITQSQEFNADGLDAIMDISNQIMFPYSDVVDISVIGVEIDENQVATVAWARALNNGDTPAVGSPVTVPSNIREADSFLVTAIVSTDHEPAFKFVGYKNGKLTFDDAAIELSEQMFLRPRIGGMVSCTDC